MNKKSWPLGSQILHPSFRITLPTAAALVLIPDLPPIAHGSAGRRTRDQCVRLSGPYTSSHREKRRPSSRLGRKPNFEAQQTTTKAPKHTAWTAMGTNRQAAPSPQATVMVRPTSSFFGGLSSRSFVSLKRPKIAVATCKQNQKLKKKQNSPASPAARLAQKKTRQRGKPHISCHGVNSNPGESEPASLIS